MQIDCPLHEFRVAPGSQVNLSKRPTEIDNLSKNKQHYLDLLAEYRTEIKELQAKLYAHDHYALLMIFQGMDTAGKGGAIKHVMSGVNPQGCQVFNFGPPSHEELDHDFLWRTNKRLPERGRIGIFDRSYYEEVLVVRVHPEILQKQRVPDQFLSDPNLWQQRFQDIVNMETYLYRNGTQTIKFFLHLSKEEQCKRLLSRIDDPQKNWKFTLNDLTSRRHWDEYQKVFAECLSQTSTDNSPWYLVPADTKRNARLIVSQILLETLKSLPIKYPRATEDHLQQLDQAKQELKK